MEGKGIVQTVVNKQRFNYKRFLTRKFISFPDVLVLGQCVIKFIQCHGRGRDSQELRLHRR